MCFAANRCSNLEGAVQFTLFVGAFSVYVFRSLALLEYIHHLGTNAYWNKTSFKWTQIHLFVSSEIFMVLLH